MCHISHVTCHMSRVRCEVLGVKCHIFLLFYFLDKVVELVGGESVLNGPTLSSLSIF